MFPDVVTCAWRAKLPLAEPVLQSKQFPTAAAKNLKSLSGPKGGEAKSTRVCTRACVCVCVDVHTFLGISRLCCEPQVPFSADRAGPLWAGGAQAAKEEFPRWGQETID